MKIPNFIKTLKQKTFSTTKVNQRWNAISLKTMNLFTKKNRKIFCLGLGFLVGGILVYDRLMNNEIEVFYVPTDKNNRIVEYLTSIKEKKYYGSPLLFIRCMEIIFGNKFGKRINMTYDREIVYAADNENIALGKLTRLGL